ncbi:hypothetical protein ATY81_08010 [Rhizobium sp. R72]|nr:hypothetical protein ATY81_08010 [Rhizobium sp. R72]OWV97711.1 hypothetical protein ATY80_08010 [Rhizobium sp. R711]
MPSEARPQMRVVVWSLRMPSVLVPVFVGTALATTRRRTGQQASARRSLSLPVAGEYGQSDQSNPAEVCGDSRCPGSHDSDLRLSTLAVDGA